MSLPAHSVSALVLGSGTSQGVPMIGCFCPVCTSTDPRDQRTRCSLYLTTPETAILIDTTPELRVQALREKLDRVDSVLFTHAHADHIMGFDDLRRFCELSGQRLPIYGNKATLESLERIFSYAFQQKQNIPGYVHVHPQIISSPFSLGRLQVTPFELPHGSMTCLGYLFCWEDRKLLAYCTDCADVPEPALNLIQDVEVLFIDGLRDRPHPTHLSVSGAIAIAQKVKAKQTYLIHLAHDKRHAERAKELPPGIELAYDGLRLDFSL